MSKQVGVTVTQVPMGDIIINTRYQREVNEKFVDDKVAHFDENLVQPARGYKNARGKVELIDGQHTKLILEGVGYTHCPVIVSNGPLSKLEQRALHFVGWNTGRRQPKTLQIFRAELVGKAPRAVALDRITKDHGLTIGTDIHAVSALNRIYEEGGEAALKETLQFLLDTWGKGVDKAFCGEILLGTSIILSDQVIDHKRLSRKLQAYTPAAIKREAGSYAGGGSFGGRPGGVALVMRTIYNKYGKNKV